MFEFAGNLTSLSANGERSFNCSMALAWHNRILDIEQEFPSRFPPYPVTMKLNELDFEYIPDWYQSADDEEGEVCGCLDRKGWPDADKPEHYSARFVLNSERWKKFEKLVELSLMTARPSRFVFVAREWQTSNITNINEFLKSDAVANFENVGELYMRLAEARLEFEE